MHAYGWRQISKSKGQGLVWGLLLNCAGVRMKLQVGDMFEVDGSWCENLVGWWEIVLFSFPSKNKSPNETGPGQGA